MPTRNSVRRREVGKEEAFASSVYEDLLSFPELAKLYKLPDRKKRLFLQRALYELGVFDSRGLPYGKHVKNGCFVVYEKRKKRGGIGHACYVTRKGWDQIVPKIDKCLVQKRAKVKQLG